MSLLVVGSIAIDSVQTPRGEVAEALGGSGAYFAYAASFFGPVRVVGVIGEDFPGEFLAILTENANIDTAGVRREPGKSFRWKGRYLRNMNIRKTLEVHLNVLEHFDPDLPSDYRDSRFVFLANASPVVQHKVLRQVREPRLVVADTMDLWIETQREALVDLLGEVDGVMLNDQEALLLTQADSLVEAARKVLGLGPKFVVVKKGEHGALYLSQEGACALSAYPTDVLVDPTGAGDTFAGAMMGYLATNGNWDHRLMKRALAYGTVVASIAVEGFSLQSLQRSTRQDIESRYERYRGMLQIE